MDEDLKEATSWFKKLATWFICLLLIVGGVVWFFSRSESVVQTGIIRYEEFQEIYNTCQKRILICLLYRERLIPTSSSSNLVRHNG